MWGLQLFSLFISTCSSPLKNFSQSWTGVNCFLKSTDLNLKSFSSLFLMKLLHLARNQVFRFNTYIPGYKTEIGGQLSTLFQKSDSLHLCIILSRVLIKRIEWPSKGVNSSADLKICICNIFEFFNMINLNLIVF